MARGCAAVARRSSGRSTELLPKRSPSEPEDAHTLGMSSKGGQVLTSVDGFALISDPWLNGRLTTLHACSDLWASGARVTTAKRS